MPAVTDAQLQRLSPEDRARIEARYPKGHGRLIGSLLAAALILTLGPWTVWSGLHHANPGVTGQVHGFDVVSDNEVNVRLDVHRPDPKVSALCSLAAEAESGATVGELTVALSPGTTKDTTREVTIKTSIRATTAILVECHRV